MPDRAKDAKRAWSQEELDLLHEMVQDYQHAKWFKGQMKWWAVWIVGLPATILAVWEPIEKLWRTLKGILRGLLS